MNNILKTVADWKQLSASSVINNVHDIVRVQYSDVRRALYGQSNFLSSRLRLVVILCPILCGRRRTTHRRTGRSVVSWETTATGREPPMSSRPTE